jgi:hypothetical protein
VGQRERNVILKNQAGVVPEDIKPVRLLNDKTSPLGRIFRDLI